MLLQNNNKNGSNCTVFNATQKQLSNSYHTPKVIDKGVFTLLKLIIFRLYKEFKNLDKISEIDCDNFLINSQGYIRISHSNLATIIKKAFQIEKKSDLSFSAKLETLYKKSKNILLVQNKNLQKQPENDVSKISVDDINKVLSDILQDNIINQSDFKPSEKNKLNNLILEMIEKLPITLITKSLYKKSFLGATNKDMAEKPKSSIIIEKGNAQSRMLNKFLKDKEKRKLNEISPIGEGRRPKNKKGILDTTEISDISNWPDQCK